MTSLVIQTAFLGDVVLTTPLLAALAERYGPVDVVTTPAAVPLLEGLPAVRNVIPYDKRGADRGWRGLRTLAARLRDAGYERAYLPHRSLRSAALAWLARIPSRIGFRDGWPFLYTESRRRPADGHEIDRLLALADRPAAAYPPAIALSEADRAAASELLRDLDAPIVALAPGSIWGTKRWPYFPELARALAPRASVVVVGSRDDAGFGAEIAAAVGRSGGRVVDTCGRLTLRQSAAVIARAAVLVTNDSAPLHLASAVGTPVVALFGPTIPEFGFGPIRAGDVALGIDGLACRPCSPHGPPRCPLGHHRCMREIDVAVVAQAIEETGAVRRRN